MAKRIAVTVAVCGLLLALARLGIDRWASAALIGPSNDQAEYVTQPSSIGVIRRSISATGTLKARSTVDISSQLSGQIASVNGDFNDIVRQGQVLAELDRRSYEARVSQAQAEVAMARDNIDMLSARRDQAQGKLDEAKAQREVYAARIDKARAAAALAVSRRTRGETLQRQGAGTVSAVEDARAAHETADATLREAVADAAAHEQATASLDAALREAQAELVNARAALPLRDAALDLARLDLERSAIRSPIDGVIVKRAVEPGQTVAASLDAPVLFTIAGDLSKMEIHANIDETDVGQLAPGQHAAFTVGAYPERTFLATITKIRKSGQLVQGVVTYTAILETENPDGRLLPGMTCTVRIVVEEVGPVLKVPLASVRFVPPDEGAATGQGVWVLTPDGRIDRRDVRLGPDDERDIAVLDGHLAAGERVILARARPPRSRRLFGIQF